MGFVNREKKTSLPHILFSLCSMLLSAFIKNIARAARSNAPTTMTTSLAAAAATSRSATFASSACAAARRSGANAAAASARGLAMPSAAAPLLSIKLLPPPSSRTTSSSRGFFAAAASASPASNSSLVSVLDTEIKYEADHAPQGAPELPPGWALESGKGKGNGGGTGGGGFEADGSARLSLRSTNPPPGEKITIELLVDEQDDDEESFPDEDDEEEGDAGNGGSSELGVGVVFTVTVEKDASPGSSLLFDCRSDGTYLQIMHVALEKKKKKDERKKKVGGQEDGDDDDDDDEFSVPHFDELDESLQAEFDAFLEERGVTASLGGALAALAEDKEAREYAAWLVRVRDFVAAR